MKIVADQKIPFLKGVLEPFADVAYLPGGQITAKDVRNADAIIIRTRTACNTELLKSSSVKMIASATIGFDHIDVSYLKSRGIKWTNAPGCNASSVAQYIASVLVNLASQHQFQLRNLTLGVVGAGNVGAKVAQVGSALGMRVLLNDPPRGDKEGTAEFVALPQLLTEADVITFHVPLQKNGKYPTFHLADAALFSEMKTSALLINSSRGAVCDNMALKDALRDRQIKGAVLDVWEKEPDLDRELLNLVDLGTPHIAGYSLDGKANGTAMSVNAVATAFNVPLQNWYPRDIPLPASPHIQLNLGDSPEQQVRAAINASYDIRQDSKRLNGYPELFESQRENYPLRREFPTFYVTGAHPVARAILGKIGFRI